MTEEIALRLVIVEWLDANCIGEWTSPNNWVEPAKCKTIGWVHKDDETYVQIVATLAEDGDYNQSMTIPKGMVTSMKDVG